MNTLIFVGLFMCVFVAYTSALPHPSEVVAGSEPKSENLATIDKKSEGESLVPAESAWGGYGGGWGHHGHYHHHHGHHHHGHHHHGHHHHGHHHWGR